MMNKDTTNTNTNTTTSTNNMNEDDVSVTTNGSTITMHTTTTNKSYEPLYRKSDTKNVYTTNDNDSPLDKMNPYNLIERIFLTWMSPLMSLGTRKILESEDIFSLPKELKSKILLEHTQRAWADEIKECKAKHKKVYIEKVLLKLYGSGLILAFLSTIPFIGATLVQPYFIEAIMLSISEENFNFIGMTNGIHVAIVLGIISVISIVCFNQAAYNNCFVGVKTRTAILNLIFDKALKLSIASKTAHRSGEIMTLIAADPERLWQCIIVSTWLFIGPINVILAMALLLYEVGYSALAALATMILVLLVQGKSSIEIGRVRSRLVKYTDERTKIMNEVLCGIRVVKMYDWESAVASRISFIRAKEMDLVALLQFWKALNNIFQYIGPLLISFSLFICYTSTGGKLTVSFVYKISALLNIFRMPLWLTPIGWANLSEALISLKRINNFLMLEEFKDMSTVSCDAELDKNVAIQIKNCNFYWDSSVVNQQIPPNLKDISFTIYKNSLTAIVGRVGSGKSSLISAILGEMYQANGSRYISSGKVAYCSQEHWIQNVSLIENVLFDPIEKSVIKDLLIDTELYENALDCSQLSQDLLQLPYADFTQIGERGINLSSGQKARVSICRSLYDRSATYIFDDTLSSVDMHVSKAIFEYAIMKSLKYSTRIMALSSNYHLLPQFDNIIVISDGQITASGTFEEVVKYHPEYLNYSSSKSESDIQIDIQIEIDNNVSPKKKFQFDDARDEILKKREDNDLMTKEDREEGNVKFSSYASYFASSSSKDGVLRLFFVFFIFLVSTLNRLICDLWPGLWPQYTDGAGTRSKNSFSALAGHDDTWFIQGYVAIVVITIVLVFWRSYYFISIAISSSKSLHNKVMRAVLSAPVNLYFDVTPIGRILNRFSKDLDSIDSLLPDFFLQTLQNGFQIVVVIIACIASSPWFIVVLIPMMILFYIIQRYFRCSSREMKRIEGISRSPLYVMFNSALQGMTTIRAYEKTSSFMSTFFIRCDIQSANFFYFYMSQRWLAIRLDIISNLLLFVLAVLSVGLAETAKIDPNLLGLALVNAIQLSSLLQWTVRITIDTENNMTSVERLLHFLDIPKEQDTDTTTTSTIATTTTAAAAKTTTATEFNDFGSKGEIFINNLKMRYRPNLEMSLKGFDLHIRPGTKVGFCGRTGSGKSSLMLTLFRIVGIEEDSSIIIDGYNLSEVPLSIIRSRLTIVPQDPLMLSGTLRSNLDPFEQYSDEQIWLALERSHLKEDIIEKFPNKLLHEVSERGDNISIGQRQLICIARALLRSSQIIVLDEATSNIDSETDLKIQATIRKEFKNCTVLTIAHRLETVIDYDEIVFMDQGIIKEKGHAYELLHNETGYFKSMVESLGEERSISIHSIAKKSFDELKNI